MAGADPRCEACGGELFHSYFWRCDRCARSFLRVDVPSKTMTMRELLRTVLR